ncbi:MAG TPA: Hsp20/alpha crystallin family protein [Chroococcidiopsis sp.]
MHWQLACCLNRIYQSIYQQLAEVLHQYSESNLWLNHADPSQISSLQVLETDFHIIVKVQLTDCVHDALNVSVSQETLMIHGLSSVLTPPLDGESEDYSVSRFQTIIPLPDLVSSIPPLVSLVGECLTITLRKALRSRHSNQICLLDRRSSAIPTQVDFSTLANRRQLERSYLAPFPDLNS